MTLNPQGIADYEPTVSVSTKRLAPPLGVGGRAGGEKVEISVRDNGNGIPQKVQGEDIPTLFHHQTHRAGTGLGIIPILRYREGARGNAEMQLYRKQRHRICN